MADEVKITVITRDPEVLECAKKAFRLDEVVQFFEDWKVAFESTEKPDMMIVDMVSTLDEPHKVAGYERFAHAKMDHALLKSVPLVMLNPPVGYDMDFYTGWPDFIFASLPKPITDKVLRRVVTYL